MFDILQVQYSTKRKQEILQIPSWKRDEFRALSHKYGEVFLKNISIIDIL